MTRKLLFVFAAAILATSRLHAQAAPTAVRAGDLQIGVGYSFASPDYTEDTFRGPSIYASFDFREHWGIEADFHQVTQPSKNGGGQNIYERTYEIGGRYVRHYRGFINPYAKVMVGRGVFNFPNNTANLAYNMYSLGGGIDFNVQKHINVRGDYEFQKWPSFPINGLSPQVLTIGVAYHFR